MNKAMTQVLSYGGGRQTVAMVLLVGQGILPRPDRIIIADTGREARSTWQYLDSYVAPYLAEFDIAVERAPHDLATVDLYSHGGSLLIPAFTLNGKLPTWCSNEWKAYVVQRHLRASGVRQAEQWIGFTIDERHRIKRGEHGPWHREYPLTDLMLTRADCEQIITRHGWPLPPKSRCWMCPNQGNEEWRQLRDELPKQFAEAVALDEDIRALDERGGVFLHHSRVPLAEADLDTPDRVETGRPCGLGMCWV